MRATVVAPFRPVLLKAVQEQLYLTVRAAYDRTLADDEDDYVRLRAAVFAEKPIARFAHYLRPAAAKKAAHRPLRPATSRSVFGPSR